LVVVYWLGHRFDCCDDAPSHTPLLRGLFVEAIDCDIRAVIDDTKAANADGLVGDFSVSRASWLDRWCVLLVAGGGCVPPSASLPLLSTFVVVVFVACYCRCRRR
jgi:hypothetical protein